MRISEQDYSGARTDLTELFDILTEVGFKGKDAQRLTEFTLDMASEKLINSLISEIRALGARLDAFNARMDSSLAGLRWMFGGMLALLAIGLTAIGILISAI